MKKLTLLLATAVLLSGAAFAGGKNCCTKGGKACCKDKKECSKDSKEAKTTNKETKKEATGPKS